MAIQGFMSTRCNFETCRRKLNLAESIRGKCKCEKIFCSKHVYSNEHNCDFDYKEENKSKLEKDNPKIVAKKVSQI